MQLLTLALLTVGLCAVYALVGVTIVRRFTKPHVREGHNDVLVPLFLTAGTLYAVLLGFLVIAVWENYGAAKDNAAEEASTLTTLYRQTNGMPPAEQAMMRGLLRDYTEAVVTKEWSIQAATGGASPVARKALGDMYRMFATLKPSLASSSINQVFLGTLGSVADDRNRRTLQANESLSGVIWAGVLVGGAIVIAMTFIIFMERPLPHIIASVLMASLIGTLLLMMTLLDRPFTGPLALASDAFEHSMSVYAAVDGGN